MVILGVFNLLAFRYLLSRFRLYSDPLIFSVGILLEYLGDLLDLFWIPILFLPSKIWTIRDDLRLVARLSWPRLRLHDDLVKFGKDIILLGYTFLWFLLRVACLLWFESEMPRSIVPHSINMHDLLSVLLLLLYEDKVSLDLFLKVRDDVNLLKLTTGGTLVLTWDWSRAAFWFLVEWLHFLFEGRLVVGLDCGPALADHIRLFKVRLRYFGQTPIVFLNPRGVSVLLQGLDIGQDKVPGNAIWLF